MNTWSFKSQEPEPVWRESRQEEINRQSRELQERQAAARAITAKALADAEIERLKSDTRTSRGIESDLPEREAKVGPRVCAACGEQACGHLKNDSGMAGSQLAAIRAQILWQHRD